MSLAISSEKITEVLLGDGWHKKVKAFVLASYEYQEGAGLDACPLHRGDDNGVCASGFEFYESDNTSVSGPLTAILAVRQSA